MSSLTKEHNSSDLNSKQFYDLYVLYNPNIWVWFCRWFTLSSISEKKSDFSGNWKSLNSIRRQYVIISDSLIQEHQDKTIPGSVLLVSEIFYFCLDTDMLSWQSVLLVLVLVLVCFKPDLFSKIRLQWLVLVVAGVCLTMMVLVHTIHQQAHSHRATTIWSCVMAAA